MKPVTPEEIRKAVEERRIAWMPHHDCAICGVMVGYVFEAGTVSFESSCDCSRSPLQPRSYDDVAEHFNRQTPEVRAQMWETLLANGINPDVTPMQITAMIAVAAPDALVALVTRLTGGEADPRVVRARIEEAKAEAALERVPTEAAVQRLADAKAALARIVEPEPGPKPLPGFAASRRTR